MDEVYKQIVNIAKKYNTKKVVLFGSRAEARIILKVILIRLFMDVRILVIYRIVLMRSCGLY